MNYTSKRTKSMRGSEDGSALLVTLMVMVGLSIIGLGYVAISETESAISLNERNATQTRELAEAGARAFVEMFQDPQWAEETSLLPPTINDIKTDRIVDGASIGRYKPGTRLFDKPHKAADSDRFWGDEDHADVWINNTKLATAASAPDKAYLNNLNKTMFNGDYSAGRITEIRVYAPPFGGGVLQDGFYKKNEGIRLGLCTIAVTATKCRNDSDADPCTDASPESRIISRRTVRVVISEWPFPGPSGPVQTNANLGTNGNVQVHWGQITATGTMKLKRPFGALPWHDAYTTVNYQYGYALPAGVNNPWPSDPASADKNKKYDWLYAIAGKSIEDPWWQARTRGDFTGDGTGGAAVAYKYDQPELTLYDTSGSGTLVRSIFQTQTSNTPPDVKSVLFPKFDYNFWKDVALTGDDQDNVFYLSWVSGDTFKDKDGTVKAVEDWINAAGGSKAGFYFFDTKNGQNPQNGGPGTLTPAVSVKGNPFQAQGFIYLNASQWDSAGGAKGVDGYYNAPGEPYKDIGYWQVNVADGTWLMNGPDHVIADANNGEWDHQDLPGGTTDVFDYFVAERTFKRPANGGGTTGADVKVYFPVPYTPGCTVGVNCSEPHEPYLNYEYNGTGTVGGATVATVNKSSGNNQTDVTVKWSNANSGKGQTLPKTTSDTKATGTPVSCNAPPADKKVLWAQCTSNSWDKNGPLVPLDPGLNGVLYVEGEFEQTGNMIFFGSILAQGDFGKAGSPDVWFDERLIKDEWPPRDFKFPRVFISAIQSD
ncbi:MAG TPA: pilus assembly PilX N-terminal domain-containing protein [Thermoanaerobaculia bacterium]